MLSTGTTAQHIDIATASSCGVRPSAPRAHITSHVKDLEDLKLKKGLFAYEGFKLISREDYEVQRKRQREKDALEDVGHEEHWRQQQERQIRLQREKANERQRRHREKKRVASINQNKRDAQLLTHDSSPSDMLNAKERSLLAASSRPRVAVLETVRPQDPSRTGGRPRIHEKSRMKKRVQWTAPHLWSVITEVASLPGHRYEKLGTRMLQSLRIRNKDFRALTPQVLNRFFVGSPPNRTFSQKILEQAARHNVYQPRVSTRHGALVCNSLLFLLSERLGFRFGTCSHRFRSSLGK